MIEFYGGVKLEPISRQVSAFRFNGVLSSDLGIIITETPENEIPERDVEVMSIPGRNGDLVLDLGRYANTRVKYECSLIPEWQKGVLDSPFSQDIIGAWPINGARAVLYSLAEANVCKAFFPSQKYYRLEDTYHPHIFRMARVTAGIKLQNISNQVGKFTLELECKPQKFLVSGEVSKVFTEATPQINRYLYNFSAQTAKPIIKVFGSGSGTLSVCGIVVELKDLTDPITLDCEMQNAYSQTGDGPMVNKNSDIYAPEFPQLTPGPCDISWTGGVERVEIIPRWWVL